MENDINRLSLDFKNILLEQNEECLDFIKDFLKVNGTQLCSNV